MSDQLRRCWDNIKSALIQRNLFAGPADTSALRMVVISEKKFIPVDNIRPLSLTLGGGLGGVVKAASLESRKSRVRAPL